MIHGCIDNLNRYKDKHHTHTHTHTHTHAAHTHAHTYVLDPSPPTRSWGGAGPSSFVLDYMLGTSCGPGKNAPNAPRGKTVTVCLLLTMNKRPFYLLRKETTLWCNNLSLNKC